MEAKYSLAIAGTILIGLVIYNAAQRRRILPPVFVRKTLAKNYNARTIPPFGIFIAESQKDNKALLDHELVHWNQYQKMGLLNFYAQYLSEKKKHGYDNMPMEIEARRNESEHCKTNYTECVRNGTSKTVHNPNFSI